MTDSVLDRLTTALAERYRVEREIGAGGMATVYLAHDIKHGNSRRRVHGQNMDNPVLWRGERADVKVP